MMSKKYRTALPPHALAEIKQDPKQAPFWENWQAVGDAKLDASDAFDALVEAEQAYTDCRNEALTKGRPLVNGCGCGKHLQQVKPARQHYETQRDQVTKAIDSFKRGK